MKQIRKRIIMLCGWMMLCIIVDLLLPAINFSLSMYVLMLFLLIGVLVVTTINRLFGKALLLAPAPLLIVARLITRQFTGLGDLPLLLVETLLLQVIIYQGYRISLAVSEFEEALVLISLSQPSRKPEREDKGMGVLYREVRRARNHQRPLTLMAISIDETVKKIQPERIMLEARTALARQYVLSGVSNTLVEKLEDCDIVVRTNDRFLVLLPETRPSDLPGLVERLRRQVDESMGVDLRVGSASLPGDSYTLEGLIEKAIQDMTDQLDAVEPAAVKAAEGSTINATQ